MTSSSHSHGVTRDLDRLFPDDVSGTDLRIQEQIRFAAYLTDHRDGDAWAVSSARSSTR